MSEQEQLNPLADRVIATLDGFAAPALFALAAGLAIAGPPLKGFQNPIHVLALEREQGVDPSWLATLTMRSALRHASLDRDFIERLVTADDPFWAAVRDAPEVIAEERRYTTA